MSDGLPLCKCGGRQSNASNIVELVNSKLEFGYGNS
jgi:hypothetical protein